MAEQANQAAAGQGGEYPPVPADAIIILPVRQTVLFPGWCCRSRSAGKSSIAAAQEAVRGERPLGVVLQIDPGADEPTPEQLHRLGTAAQILRYVTAPDGTHHVIAQGLRRFRLLDFLPGYPFLVARVEEIGVSEVITPEIEARVGLVARARPRGHAIAAERSGRGACDHRRLGVRRRRWPTSSPASPMQPAEKQEVLETIDVKQRLDKVLALLASASRY